MTGELDRLKAIMLANGLAPGVLWEIESVHADTLVAAPYPQAAPPIRITCSKKALLGWAAAGQIHFFREEEDYVGGISILVPAELHNAGFFRIYRG